MDRLSVEPVDGTGPSYYLRDEGTWEQMREYFVHRSLYHLKEGDPHAWAIPRLTGQAKASFVAVEFDEYGGGRGARVHQQLFADLMDAAGLDSSYLGLPRRRPRRVVGRGELDVAVRVAPRVAWRGDRAFRVDRDHLVARFAPDGGGAGADGRAASRASASTASMSRPTPFTSKWCAPTWSVTWSPREPQLDRDVVFGIRARDLVEDRLATI